MIRFSCDLRASTWRSARNMAVETYLDWVTTTFERERPDGWASPTAVYHGNHLWTFTFEDEEVNLDPGWV